MRKTTKALAVAVVVVPAATVLQAAAVWVQRQVLPPGTPASASLTTRLGDVAALVAIGFGVAAVVLVWRFFDLLERGGTLRHRVKPDGNGGQEHSWTFAEPTREPSPPPWWARPPAQDAATEGAEQRSA